MRVVRAFAAVREGGAGHSINFALRVAEIRATFPPGYVGGAGGTRSLTRSQNCRSCIVGMEACCGAHHLGRLFAAQGHDGRLMSPEYVRPYVKAPKNDDRDAEGIAEAATRPTMRFVEMKTQDQIDMQTLHRSRVALINQLRAVLLDRGILVPQGKRKLEQYLVIVMNEDDGKGLSARMRMLVADIRAQWQELDRQIGEFDAEFVRWAKENEDARRLVTIPGVGVTISTALIAAVGAPNLMRVAVLRDPASAAGIGQFAAIQAVASSVGVELSTINVRSPDEIEGAAATFARSVNGGLIVPASPPATQHRGQIIRLAAQHRLPAIYFERFLVADGGLMSYGPDLVDQYRRAASYVDRILKGEKPADCRCLKFGRRSRRRMLTRIRLRLAILATVGTVFP